MYLLVQYVICSVSILYLVMSELSSLPPLLNKLLRWKGVGQGEKEHKPTYVIIKCPQSACHAPQDQRWSKKHHIPCTNLNWVNRPSSKHYITLVKYINRSYFARPVCAIAWYSCASMKFMCQLTISSANLVILSEVMKKTDRELKKTQRGLTRDQARLEKEEKRLVWN